MKFRSAFEEVYAKADRLKKQKTIAVPHKGCGASDGGNGGGHFEKQS